MVWCGVWVGRVGGSCGWVGEYKDGGGVGEKVSGKTAEDAGDIQDVGGCYR